MFYTSRAAARSLRQVLASNDEAVVVFENEKFAQRVIAQLARTARFYFNFEIRPDGSFLFFRLDPIF